MSRQIDVNAVINWIRLKVQGTNATTPDAGYVHLFLKTDGVYVRFSDGTVAGPFGTNVAVGGTFALAGDISPAQITADQNDYNPTGLSGAAVLRLSSDASRNVTGLAGGADGRLLVIHNVGAQNIVLKDESASSSAGNRFALTGDLTLTADSVAILQYDATTTRWRAVSGGGGAGVTDGDKGDVTVSGSGATWTIDNDAVTYAKMQNVSATDRLLGRDTAGAGDVEEITPAAARTMLNVADGATAYSDELAQDAVGTILVDTATIDLTYSDATPSIAADVKDDSVTYAKLQNVSAASRLLGRGSAAGAGDTQEMTVGAGLSISGMELAATGTAAVLDVNVTEVGNVGTGEDDLIAYSVAANTLGVNEEYLHFVAGGTFAGNVNNKRLRVKFGATTLFDSGSLAVASAADWLVEGWIVREGAAVQKCLVRFTSSFATLMATANYAGATEDLTTTLTLKLTGEATTDNDVVQESLVVEKGGGAGGGSSSPIGARAYNSANFSVANNDLTVVVTLDSERYDTDTIHDTSSNTSRLTCKTAGYYLIIANIEWAQNSGGGWRMCRLRLNGATIIAQVADSPSGGAINQRQEVSTIYNLSVNDYVELAPYQDSGGAVNIQAASNYSPEFMMQKIG